MPPTPSTTVENLSWAGLAGLTGVFNSVAIFGKAYRGVNRGFAIKPQVAQIAAHAPPARESGCALCALFQIWHVGAHGAVGAIRKGIHQIAR